MLAIIIFSRPIFGHSKCKNCGAKYNLETLPPKKDGICDKCGGELFQREDDAEGAIRTRFEVYEKQTKPLIERYRSTGKLTTVDAGQSIDAIYAELLRNVSN